MVVAELIKVYPLIMADPVGVVYRPKTRQEPDFHYGALTVAQAQTAVTLALVAVAVRARSALLATQTAAPVARVWFPQLRDRP